MKISRLTLACLFVLAGPALHAETANTEHRTVNNDSRTFGQKVRDATHRMGNEGRKVGHDLANAGRQVGHDTAQAGRNIGHRVRHDERHADIERHTETTHVRREQHASAAGSDDAGSASARQRRMDDAYESYRSQAQRQR